MIYKSSSQSNTVHFHQSEKKPAKHRALLIIVNQLAAIVRAGNSNNTDSDQQNNVWYLILCVFVQRPIEPCMAVPHRSPLCRSRATPVISYTSHTLNQSLHQSLRQSHHYTSHTLYQSYPTPVTLYTSHYTSRTLHQSAATLSTVYCPRYN